MHVANIRVRSRSVVFLVVVRSSDCADFGELVVT